MGVACPVPGIFTFHLMWLDSLQVVGGLAAGATPVARGPRHCGQCWSAAGAAAPIEADPKRIAAADTAEGQDGGRPEAREIQFFMMADSQSLRGHRVKTDSPPADSLKARFG